MSVFDNDEELNNIENLQQQTRDPFQLELLDAVKKRQKKETGFENDVDRSTQRHSKEMDVKMSKFLSNKQSPYRIDNSSGESSLKGDIPATMSLGSAGAINNKAAGSAHNSKWKPSVSIESEDDIDEDIDSDEEDDIVIGHSTKISDKIILNNNDFDERIVKKDLKSERNDLITHIGLTKEVDDVRGKKELTHNKESISKKDSDKSAHHSEVSSLERPGFQRKKGIVDTEQHLETKLSPAKDLKDKETYPKDNYPDKGVSMEKPMFGRRGNFGSRADEDDEVDAINAINLNEFEPSPGRKSKIDDIFDNTRSRKQDSVKNYEGNLRNAKKDQVRSTGEESDYESPVEFGRRPGALSPRSRSGSGRDSPGDILKSKPKKSVSGMDEKQTKNRYEDEKSKLRSSSGRNNPDAGKMGPHSGRSSPADGLISSVSRKLSQPQMKGKKPEAGRPKSRSSSGRNTPDAGKMGSLSGRSSPADGFTSSVSRKLSQPEKKGKKPEAGRPRSGSSSGRNTPDAGKTGHLSGRNSPGDGLISNVSRKLSQSEKKGIKSKAERPKSGSGSGRNSPSDLFLSKSKGHELSSKEKKDRPKSAKSRKAGGEEEKMASHHYEKGTDKIPSSRSSRKEAQHEDESELRGGKSRSKSPEYSSKRSSNHRRSHSIGNSRREIEDNESPSPRDKNRTSRERSRSDAGNLGKEFKRTSSRNEDFKDKKDENEFNKLGSKFSLKRPGSMRSLRGKEAGLDSDDDDDDDDDAIGIRRQGSTSRKDKYTRDNRDSRMNEDRKKGPSIKRPLGTEMHSARKLASEEDSEEEVREVQSKFTGQRSKGEASSKQGKEPLSKFKVKGRTEGQQSRTTPIKPNMDIKAAKSVPDKSRKDHKGSPRDHGKANKTMTKRSLSFTNISNIKPKSPYPENGTEPEKRRNSIVDSETLREQIYYDWLKQKTTKTKGELMELQKKEKEKEEEAEREKKDKKIMSQKAFEAWQSQKEEKLKEKHSESKEKKMKEKEKQDELQQKKIDSKKYFESWKSKKEEELIEQRRKKKEEEREKRRKEFEDKEEKLTSSKKVYENWKSKKEELLKEKIKEKKEQDKEKKLKEIERMEKKRKAEKLFDTWKDSKEKSPREKTVLTQRAWCPSGRNSGNNIPDGVQPVIQRNPPNRSRTLSATARIQNRTMNSTFKRT